MIERVTKSMIEKELTSSEFYLGMQEITKFSIETGREAEFVISKKLFEDTFVYPILIQTGTTCGIPKEPSVEKVITDYRSQMKKDPNQNITEFLEFCSQYYPGFIQYPKVDCKQQGEFQDGYFPFIHFHTHPSGQLFAHDITFTNKRRKEIIKKIGIPVSQIEGIIAINKDASRHELVMWQEKGVGPLTDLDLAVSSSVIYHYCKLTPEEYRHKRILCSSYNIARGAIDLDTQKVIFYKGLANFAYKIECTQE